MADAEIENQNPAGDPNPNGDGTVTRLFAAAEQLGVTPLGVFAARVAQSLRLREQVVGILETNDGDSSTREPRHDPPSTP